MKIGIISINMYSKGLNFACPLHSYAFQQFLTKNGINNIIINYKPVYYDSFDLKHPYDYYKKKVDGCEKKLSQNNVDKREVVKKMKYFQDKCDAWKPLYQEREVRYEKMQNFIDTRYIKTDICYDSDLLEIMDPCCDTYICATDVIWKPLPNFGFDRGFFLGSSCMENKKKIAYAASKGVHFPDNKKDEELFFHYLEDFDAISVREESLKTYIEEHCEQKVTSVIDPVLLHEKEFYEDILVKPEEENYLFLYYVMEKAADTIQYAVEYAKKYNLTIVEVSDMPEKGGRLNSYKGLKHIYKYDIGIEEWLGYFKYAAVVFTNSFHASCFSILFEKDFYVGSRHGDKVSNIMETFGIQHRLIAQYGKNLAFPLPEIDYEQVGKILKEKRKESADFLLSAIADQGGKKKKQDYTAYKKSLQFPLGYNSKLKNKPFFLEIEHAGCEGKLQQMPSGTLEYTVNESVLNDGTYILPEIFVLQGYEFVGWNLRFRIDNRWFWYLENGKLVEKTEYKKKKDGEKYLVHKNANLPYIPVNRIAKVVAEAVWEKQESEDISHSEKVELDSTSLKSKLLHYLRKMIHEK